MTIKEMIQTSADIRKKILFMANRAQSAHTGGALSCVEILTALYFKIMHVDPKNPTDIKRDRFILSKAHDAKALFAVLAERGFFEKRILAGYEANDGLLPGHTVRNCVPGVESSAGSLGHGLPIAVGMALALKKTQLKNIPRVFVLISDGECDEGTTWESALFAAQYSLDNLVLIIDYNKLQGFGFTKDVLDLEPLNQKWQAFNWDVYEVNGNNIDKIIKLFKSLPYNKGKPMVIIAHTIKGLGGVEKYVNTISSQYLPPTDSEYKETISKL
jgi:transketolase